MRMPLMKVLIDASSTAASHDPGATLRRLRPPYHAGDSVVEPDRGVLRFGVGSGEFGVNAFAVTPHPPLSTVVQLRSNRTTNSRIAPRACTGSPCSTARRPRGR